MFVRTNGSLKPSLLAAILGVATMAPLGFAVDVAQADPPSHAPAWGYRRKADNDDWGTSRRERKTERRTTRRERKLERRQLREERRYRLRYRTRTDSDGRRYRQYYR